jgi:hypothetical protein
MWTDGVTDDAQTHMTISVRLFYMHLVQEVNMRERLGLCFRQRKGFLSYVIDIFVFLALSNRRNIRCKHTLTLHARV